MPGPAPTSRNTRTYLKTKHLEERITGSPLRNWNTSVSRATYKSIENWVVSLSPCIYRERRGSTPRVQWRAISIRTKRTYRARDIRPPSARRNIPKIRCRRRPDEIWIASKPDPNRIQMQIFRVRLPDLARIFPLIFWTRHFQTR